MAAALPLIDVSSLAMGLPSGRLSGDDLGASQTAEEIGKACRDIGFFYAVGHAISEETLAELDRASRRFFALPQSQKLEIAMARGGRAWRGYFPVGGELTSGRPDLKEGLYFGEELGPDDPRVARGLPLHGANLFPDQVPELQLAVLRFMAQAETSAHAIMAGIALSLGLKGAYFHNRYTAKPTLLFRVFNYPPSDPNAGWGVGEHTDYGLLTLLAQDLNGGLEVKTPRGWIEAPPIPGALVCNIGDMLDKLTSGVYRSTPHRVLNRSGRSRLSFPFFFDPAFDAEIEPLPSRASADDGSSRWDGANIHNFNGAYGDYLMAKVVKVFPDLSPHVGVKS